MGNILFIFHIENIRYRNLYKVPGLPIFHDNGPGIKVKRKIQISRKADICIFKRYIAMQRSTYMRIKDGV